MVVGSGDKIMAGRGWWQQHFGWPGVVVGGGNRIMADRGWSWMVARFSNAQCDVIFNFALTSYGLKLSLTITIALQEPRNFTF